MKNTSDLRKIYEDRSQEYLRLKAALRDAAKLSPKELEGLNYLNNIDEPVRVGDLAEPLGISYSRITRLMDVLTRKKLAVRKTAKIDRRSWMASITAKGSEFISDYNKALDRFFENKEAE